MQNADFTKKGEHYKTKTFIITYKIRLKNFNVCQY